MAEMRNFEAEAAAWVGEHLPHLRHPGSEVNLLTDDERHQENPQDQPQETHMTATKLSAAREAISAIADNPLIDAIAEAGIGKWMSTAEVKGVVALWREVEYGRQQRDQRLAEQQADQSQQTPAQQPTSAQQLQPQQTA